MASAQDLGSRACASTWAPTTPASSSRTTWSRWLREQGHEPVDHGPFVYDALDDYPVFCLRAAEAVVADEGSLGVVIGGSGNGEQIAANKVRGRPRRAGLERRDRRAGARAQRRQRASRSAAGCTRSRR